MKPKKGKLFLIPNLLGEQPPKEVLPESVYRATADIKLFIVENIRNARRFLKKLHPTLSIDSIEFYEMEKHRDYHFPKSLLDKTQTGQDVGLVSEAGNPCIADPGHQVVQAAHKKGILVMPLAGPSSVLMALTASGMNGQQFRFHGYLPRDRKERIKTLLAIEKSIKHGETQIFMDTPFRSNHVLEDILANCRPDTLLCIAANISLSNQMIKTQAVKNWKKKMPDLHKTPCIFVMGS